MIVSLSREKEPGEERSWEEWGVWLSLVYLLSRMDLDIGNDLAQNQHFRGGARTGESSAAVSVPQNLKNHL